MDTAPGLAAFRDHIAPAMPARQLKALLAGLANDDGALLQGAVCDPPPVEYPGKRLDETPCEGACAMCFGAWAADRLVSVGEVADAWSDLAAKVDRTDPFAVGSFTAWFDQEPRREVVPALAAVVRAELARREKA